MISMDSPVETVLGDTGTKAPKIAKGLGLRTVGELVHHLPRRYVRTRELTTVDTLEEGELRRDSVPPAPALRSGRGDPRGPRDAGIAAPLRPGRHRGAAIQRCIELSLGGARGLRYCSWTFAATRASPRAARAEEIFSTVNRYTETVSEIVRKQGGVGRPNSTATA